MSSPLRRSLQMRGRNCPARNALHPPRGARSAVACRALSGAPAPARARQPGLPRGPRAGRGGSGALPQVARAGQRGHPLAPPSRVANPSATTAAGVATTRRGPTSSAVADVPAVAPWRIGGPVILQSGCSTSSTWNGGPGGRAAGRAPLPPGFRGRAGVAGPPSVGAVMSGLRPGAGSHRVPDTAPTSPVAAVAVVKTGSGSVSWGAPWGTSTTPVVSSST